MGQASGWEPRGPMPPVEPLLRIFAKVSKDPEEQLVAYKYK